MVITLGWYKIYSLPNLAIKEDFKARHLETCSPLLKPSLSKPVEPILKGSRVQVTGILPSQGAFF